MNTHTLTRHRDIQSWVSNRHGQPALRRVPNRFGQMEARLALTFKTPKAPPVGGMPQSDDGLSPCSWTAWLAELDRRHLALKVSDLSDADFEFVERKTLN